MSETKMEKLRRRLERARQNDDTETAATLKTQIKALKADLTAAKDEPRSPRLVETKRRQAAAPTNTSSTAVAADDSTQRGKLKRRHSMAKDSGDDDIVESESDEVATPKTRAKRTKTEQYTGSLKNRSPRSPRLVELKRRQEEEEEDEFSKEEVGEMSMAEFRIHHGIQVTGARVTVDLMTWEACENIFDTPLLDAVKRLKFGRPSPVQAHPFQSVLQSAIAMTPAMRPTTWAALKAVSWPIALAGCDVLSVAKTGSGKTCGFLFPAFQLISLGRAAGTARNGRKEWTAWADPPTVLVLAPTRELAAQIHDEANKFGRPLKIRSHVVFGGAPKSSQIRGLENGCECLIATPGRLNDLIGMGKVELGAVSYLVLDEADRMLDMGFEPQIKDILSHVPTTRQTLLFTATMAKPIEKLAARYLRTGSDVARVEIGQRAGKLVASKSVKQNVFVANYRSGEKVEKAIELIEQLAANAKKKLIVFCARKHMCDDIAGKLWSKGVKADSIHGDRDQSTRTRILQNFRQSQIQVLVATDVMARGLDIKDVTDVVNVDFGEDVDSYVHRIGRTGRADAQGEAHTFFDGWKDAKLAHDLINLMVGADQVVPDALQRLDQGPPRGGKGGKGKGGKGGKGGGWRGGGKGTGLYKNSRW